MAANLLDALNGLVTPDLLATVAPRLGESESAIGKGLAATFPTILAGLVQKSGDPKTMDQIMGLLTTSRVNYPAVLANPKSVLPGDSSGASLGDLGGSFLSALFGQQLGPLAAALSQSAGIKTSSASSLLNAAVPLVMALLAGRVRTEGLGASGLGSLLSRQRDSIFNAVPAGLANVLGLGALRGVTPPRAPRSAAALGSSMWIWAAAVGVLLLGGLLYRNAQLPDVKVPAVEAPQVAKNAVRGAGDAARGAADAAGAAAKGAADTASQAVASLGAFLPRRLPSSVELTLPERGVETQIITFIDDPTKQAEPAVWFSFDRLVFETGSATLKPASQEQLRNTAEILKAYPTVRLKIGGYTDNTGNPEANIQLSQARATTVMNELIRLGVAPDRLAAEGYGEQYPVGDNSTEEGRAQNRRIAMRVTQK